MCQFYWDPFLCKFPWWFDYCKLFPGLQPSSPLQLPSTQLYCIFKMRVVYCRVQELFFWENSTLDIPHNSSFGNVTNKNFEITWVKNPAAMLYCTYFVVIFVYRRDDQIGSAQWFHGYEKSVWNEVNNLPVNWSLQTFYFIFEQKPEN